MHLGFFCFCGILFWVFFFTSAIHVVDEFLMCSNAVKAYVSTESCDDNMHSIFKAWNLLYFFLFLPCNNNKRN